MKRSGNKVGNKKVTDPTLKSKSTKPDEAWTSKKSTGREEDLKEGATTKPEEGWSSGKKSHKP